MKVLFLDMDGVVNHHDWWCVRVRREHPNPDLEQAVIRYKAMHQIDPRCVARLNLIVERTGCAVVLSSAWRHNRGGWQVVSEQLKMRGATFSLYGATPDCARETAGGLFIGAERGAEIQEWLNSHHPIESFAIVDDDSDMGPLLPRLVRTSMERGLLDDHMVRLMDMLGAPAMQLPR